MLRALKLLIGCISSHPFYHFPILTKSFMVAAQPQYLHPAYWVPGSTSKFDYRSCAWPEQYLQVPFKDGSPSCKFFVRSASSCSFTMYSYSNLCVLVLSLIAPSAVASRASRPNVLVQQAAAQLLTDITKISGYWGQVSPYADNPEDYFGVQWVGLPSGCQIEQAHTLQRHANRFPTGQRA